MSSSATNNHWKELDVLRGIAAALMILNHTGVSVLASNEFNQAFPKSLLFVGSFAPVLFFFLTGLGSGIQSAQKKSSNRWFSVLIKVAILLIADLLWRWRDGALWGLNFLGFIGLSVLVIEILRKTKFPVLYCWIGIVGISILRYVLGPYLKSHGYGQQSDILNWLVGTSAVEGVSYPFSPWMVYPLLGFILGTAAMQRRVFLEKTSSKVILGISLVAMLPICVGIFLSTRNPDIFFRWGTVAIGFYIVSFAVILLGLALALITCRILQVETLQKMLSLKGIASLAVVPIHYFFIDLIVDGGGKNLTASAYGLTVSAVLIASFFCARFVESLGRSMSQSSQPKKAWISLVAISAGFSIVTFVVGYYMHLPFARTTTTFGQLTLCLLLAVPYPFQPVRSLHSKV